MLGEFFLSLAYELKLLTLILHEKSLKQIMRQEKRRFLRYSSIALGTIFFLTATILLELAVHPLVASIMNVLAGVCFLLSVLLLVKRDSHKGYEDFEAST